jgi:peptide/nickel transport system substrate-binding protein
MRKSLVVFLVLTLVVGIAFFGCKKKEPEITTLVYATTESITNMDTSNAYDFHTWELFQNINMALLTYAPGTTELIPGLAESYTVNDAADEYTFKLRPGLKFSDGTAFTAEAVKWSIDRVIALEGDPSWLVVSFVDSVEVIDDLTVKFNLTGPVGFFPSLVASVPYQPLNPAIYPEDRWINDPEELTGGVLTGMGPYMLSSFKRDEEIILDANPNYYGEKPKIDRIVIRYFADATTMRLALEKGEVDLVFKTLNPSDIQDLAGNDAYRYYKMPGPYIRYLCFETSEGLFSDKRLRQAVAALIDRQDIIDKVFLGQEAPLYSMVPNGMIYHTDEFKTALGDGNVELAEKLLAEAGYTAANPLEFELWYPPQHYGDTEVDMVEVMKAQFEATPAVKVELKPAEWATYIQNLDTKQMKVFTLGWYPDYIDPDNYTAAFASSDGSPGMGIYFSDPEWDALFVQEQTSTDPAEREMVFEKMQKLWADEVPTAPIFQGNLHLFTKPNVGGVNISPTLIFNYDQLFFE